VAFDDGEGLAVADSKSGKLLLLEKMGKDVRWQSIRSKEDKGAGGRSHRSAVERQRSGAIPAMRR
jgi:hypothetical protein